MRRHQLQASRPTRFWLSDGGDAKDAGINQDESMTRFGVSRPFASWFFK
jgi:hypothetical protein